MLDKFFLFIVFFDAFLLLLLVVVYFIIRYPKDSGVENYIEPKDFNEKSNIDYLPKYKKQGFFHG